jgi:hypothetical protein
VSVETVEKRPVPGAADSRLPDDHDVHASKFRLMTAKRLADDTLHPIPTARKATVFPGYRKAEPCRSLSVALRQDEEEVIAAFTCAAEHAAESGGIRQSIRPRKPVQPTVLLVSRSSFVFRRRRRPGCRRIQVLRRQLGTPFCAPPLENQPPGLGRHAGTETVIASPLQFAGLKSTFHLPGLLRCRGDAPRPRESRQGYAGRKLLSTEAHEPTLPFQ